MSHHHITYWKTGSPMTGFLAVRRVKPSSVLRPRVTVSSYWHLVNLTIQCMILRFIDLELAQVTQRGCALIIDPIHYNYVHDGVKQFSLATACDS